MSETILLIHSNRAPEFHESDFRHARYLLPDEETGIPGELTYESLGKIAVGLESDEEGLAPVAYAVIRTFAHPDVIQAVKKHGKRESA